MTLGWWADLGFHSAASLAAHARAPLAPLWCRASSSLPALAGLPRLAHLVSWMTVGMLALGMPATALVHRPDCDARRARLEMIACAIAMVAGMSAGSQLARLGTQRLGPTAIVLLDWASMIAGMMAGMTIGMAFARISYHAAIATTSAVVPTRCAVGAGCTRPLLRGARDAFDRMCPRGSRRDERRAGGREPREGGAAREV